MKDIAKYICESAESEIIVICTEKDDDWEVIHLFWEWLKTKGINYSSKRHDWKKIDRKFGEGTYDVIDENIEEFWKAIKDGVSKYDIKDSNKQYKLTVKCHDLKENSAYVEASDDYGHIAHIACQTFNA